jgi:hypothetical protein
VSAAAPLVCACGRQGGGNQTSGPYVSVKLSRIDALTLSSTRVRGPRALDAAELDRSRADAAQEAERLRQADKERANEKRKAKNASKMPVNNQIGNFTSFRNKSTPVPKQQHHEEDEEPAASAAAANLPGRKFNKKFASNSK